MLSAYLPSTTYSHLLLLNTYCGRGVYCPRSFIYIILLHLSNNPCGWLLLLSSFYVWGRWDLVRVSHPVFQANWKEIWDLHSFTTNASILHKVESSASLVPDHARDLLSFVTNACVAGRVEGQLHLYTLTANKINLRNWHHCEASQLCNHRNQEKRKCCQCNSPVVMDL